MGSSKASLLLVISNLGIRCTILSLHKSVKLDIIGTSSSMASQVLCQASGSGVSLSKSHRMFSSFVEKKMNDMQIYEFSNVIPDLTEPGGDAF